MDLNFSKILGNFGGMKDYMNKMREHLQKIKVVGETGAGMIKVTINGQSQVTNIDIDPSLLTEKEKEVLEELLCSAFNEAQKKVNSAVESEFKNAIGNLPILESLQDLFKK